MNANEIAFGIEIETTLPTSDTTPIGAYHCGLPVAWLPTFEGKSWKAERDGSVHGQCMNRKSCEFISPKMRGYAGLQNVIETSRLIKARDGRVNQTCGVHVSVSFDGDVKALARLLTLFANVEKGMYAATGTKRREVCGFAQPIKQYGNKDNAKARCERDRRHAINLTHLANGSNRIEFRLFSGSLNEVKLIGWIMLVLALVELSMTSNRSVNWNRAKSNGASGETELNRAFYMLGWKKGHYSPGRHRRYGVVSDFAGEGGAMRMADMDMVMDTLLGMARKYDASR